MHRKITSFFSFLQLITLPSFYILVHTYPSILFIAKLTLKNKSFICLSLAGTNEACLDSPFWRRKEGNVLFNDALNTFYLRIYGTKHGKGPPILREETCYHHRSAVDLTYAPSHRQDSTYHSLCYLSHRAPMAHRTMSGCSTTGLFWGCWVIFSQNKT